MSCGTGWSIRLLAQGEGHPAEICSSPASLSEKWEAAPSKGQANCTILQKKGKLSVGVSKTLMKVSVPLHPGLHVFLPALGVHWLTFGGPHNGATPVDRLSGTQLPCLLTQPCPPSMQVLPYPYVLKYASLNVESGEEGTIGRQVAQGICCCSASPGVDAKADHVCQFTDAPSGDDWQCVCTILGQAVVGSGS